MIEIPGSAVLPLQQVKFDTPIFLGCRIIFACNVLVQDVGWERAIARGGDVTILDTSSTAVKYNNVIALRRRWRNELEHKTSQAHLSPHSSFSQYSHPSDS